MNEIGALKREVEDSRIVRVVLKDESIRLEKIKVASGSVSVIDLGTLLVITSGIDNEEWLSINLTKRSDSGSGLVIEHVGERGENELSID